MDDFRRMTPEEEQIYKKRKTIKSALIVSIVLFVVLLILMFILQSKDAQTFKLFINDTQAPVSGSFILYENGEAYVAAEELANLIGYRYQKGSYGSFSQNVENAAYIQNDYEVAAFTAGSNTLKKYIQVDSQLDPEVTGITVLSESGYSETTTLEIPVIEKNGIIYLPVKALNDICNSIASLEGNQLRVYSLPYLIELAKAKAGEYKYDQISGDYENLRALAFGMMVVADNNKYGVVGLYNRDDYNIPNQYDKILFNQNVKEFLVTQKNKVGILDSKGQSVIDIDKNYEEITVLSDRLSLYLVSEDEQYGVLNREGKEIVYPEFEEVGLSQDFVSKFDIKTDDLIYIPYDTMIIARDGAKYGVYDIEDGEKLKATYTGIGCDPEEIYSKLTFTKDEDGNEVNETGINVNEDAETVLLIDIELEDGTGIKGLVVKAYESNFREERYGIYDSITGKIIIPCACTQIYKITKNGRTNYYMEFNGEQLELVDYIESHPELNLKKYNGTSADDVEEE